MWNAKTDGYHSSIFLDRVEISRHEIDMAELRAYALRSEALARHFRRMIDAGKRWAAMRRSRRELLHLSPRILEDIGLTRYEIYDTLNANSFSLASFVAPIRQFAINVGNYLKGWNERRSAYRQLSTLDDHMLEDIGIRRDEIDAIAFRGKVRKPLMHAPVSVESLRAQTVPDIRPNNGNKHIAA